MVKLSDLLKEVEEEKLEEAGVKDIFTAAALTAMAMFSPGAKGQTAAKPATTQVAQSQKDTLDINVGKYFGSGKYKLTDKDAVTQIDNQMVNFAAQNPNANYTITITSSESNVTNYDGEALQKAGKKVKDLSPEERRKFALPPNKLSELRATEVENLATAFKDAMKAKGLIKGDVKIEVNKLGAQGPKWEPEKGDEASDDKFSEHQFVNITMKATPLDVPDSTVEHFKLASSKYERIFMGNTAWAAIAYASNTTTKKADPGHVDTKYTDVLVRVFDNKKLRAATGGTLPDYGMSGSKVMSMNIFTEEAYMVPFAVWNNTGRMQMDGVPTSWAKYKVDIPSASPEDLQIKYLQAPTEKK